MVSTTYDEKQLRRRLAAIPHLAAFAFASACAARLENTARSKRPDDSDKALLGRSVDSLLACLDREESCRELVSEDELLSLMPDEDESDVSFAVSEDAAAAALYSLRFWRDCNIDNAVWAARRAYETADREVLASINTFEVGPNEEEYALNHPIVQTEIRRQLRDLDEVSSLPSNAADEWVGIVRRARSENILLPDGDSGANATMSN